MAQNGARFATLLRTAVRVIRAYEDKPLSVIRDELGYLIDHSGGDYILYLEKGHIPPNQDEIRKLVDELVRRGGLDETERSQILHAAAIPEETQWQRHESAKIFLAGPAIREPHRFFGRTREIARIFSYWKYQPLEHIAIVGPRRAGKTSLLYYLSAITTSTPVQRRPGQKHDWLLRPERMRWIYIDLQSAQMKDPDQVLRFVSERLSLPLSTPSTVHGVMEAVHSLGDTRPVILLLDELGAGFERLGRDFWWGLRAEIVNGRNPSLALVAASPVNPTRLRSTTDSTSPFTNIFADYITLGPFTELEARELIASAPPPGFLEADIDWILEHSGRWPQLVQILCQERLQALDDGSMSDDWKQEGLRRIDPFSYLLETK